MNSISEKIDENLPAITEYLIPNFNYGTYWLVKFILGKRNFIIYKYAFMIGELLPDIEFNVIDLKSIDSYKYYLFFPIQPEMVITVEFNTHF